MRVSVTIAGVSVYMVTCECVCVALVAIAGRRYTYTVCTYLQNKQCKGLGKITHQRDLFAFMHVTHARLSQSRGHVYYCDKS